MKLKIIYVWVPLFVDLCKYGTEKVKIISDALPEDTEYVRSFTDDNSGHGRIGIVVKSESWDDIREGEVIPVIPGPTFEKVMT